MAVVLVLVVSGLASPFWAHGGCCPGPDPGFRIRQERRCPDCCPYALLPRWTPRVQPRETLVAAQSALRRLAPGNPTQMSAPVPWFISCLIQLFDRWIGAHGVRRLSRLLQRGQGIPAIQFLLERVSKEGAHSSIPALLRTRPFDACELGQIGSAQSAPRKVASLELGVPKRQRAIQALRQTSPRRSPPTKEHASENGSAQIGTTEMHASIEQTAQIQFHAGSAVQRLLPRQVGTGATGTRVGDSSNLQGQRVAES